MRNEKTKMKRRKCYELKRLNIVTHPDEETDSAPSPSKRLSDPDIDLINIKETTDSPSSPDSAVTMQFISENNPPLNSRLSTPIAVKRLVPTLKCLGQVTKGIRATNTLELVRQIFHETGSSHEGKRISLIGNTNPCPK